MRGTAAYCLAWLDLLLRCHRDPQCRPGWGGGRCIDATGGTRAVKLAWRIRSCGRSQALAHASPDLASTPIRLERYSGPPKKQPQKRDRPVTDYQASPAP